MATSKITCPETNGVIQTFSETSSTLSIGLPRNYWVCGILIANINGIGNVITAVEVKNAGEVNFQSIYTTPSTQPIFSATFSGSTMIVSVKNAGGTSFAISKATWIGLW